VTGGALTAGLIALLASGLAPTFVAGQVAPAPGKRLLRLDDLYRMREVGDPRLSPDGAWVAFTVTVRDSARDEDYSAVYLVSWDGRTSRRLTWGTEGEHSPRWSPDGKSLAFLSSRGDTHQGEQVWILPRDGGEATRLTALADGVSDYAWAPDGRRLAVIARDPDPDSAAGRNGAGGDTVKAPPPIVITRFQFRADNIGWLTERRARLYVVDVPTGRATLLTPGPVDAALPSWSPDGREIAYVRKTGEDGDRTFNNDVYAIAAEPGATPRQVTTYSGNDNDPDWEGGPPAWSPDGRTIAYEKSDAPELFDYGMQHLAVTSAQGGGPERFATTP
jgi:Tol biopolymer transport system component